MKKLTSGVGLIEKLESSGPIIGLEIGVYKGRILALIQLISTLCNKNVQIYGVTPLDGTATDKYSEYQNCDYLSAIKKSYSISNVTFNNTTIIHGYSQ